MQNKVSEVGVKARDLALKGANYLAEAVKSTLGPFGMNALIEKGNRITNDGVTVSKEICGAIENEFERRGAVTLHEAAAKTNDEAGDGTTTAIVLAQAILKEAVRQLPNDKTLMGKMTPADLIRKIEAERQEITEKMEKMAIPIETKEQLINSARVSVEDEKLGKIIGETQWEIGKTGVIIAEEHILEHCEVERIKGIRTDNGFCTSNMINNQEKQSLEVTGAWIIMTNHTLSDLLPIKALLDTMVKSKKIPIVIVARGFTNECIQLCLTNHKSGVFIYPISAPYVNQSDVMKDMQAVLGGRFIDSEECELEDVMISDVGFAEKIVATRYTAIFTGKTDESTLKRVSDRVDELNKRLSGSVSDFEKKSLEARISQLTNGFAILKVGAKSELERKRLKDKCDDAVNAVRAAFQEGVIPGAGLAFKEISEGLPDGYILKRPLMAVYEQITSSAPKDFVIEDWVKDPLKVLKVALEKACSVAATFATINTVICTENPPKCNCKKQDEEQ